MSSTAIVASCVVGSIKQIVTRDTTQSIGLVTRPDAGYAYASTLAGCPTAGDKFIANRTTTLQQLVSRETDGKVDISGKHGANSSVWLYDGLGDRRISAISKLLPNSLGAPSYELATSSWQFCDSNGTADNILYDTQPWLPWYRNAALGQSVSWILWLATLLCTRWTPACIDPQSKPNLLESSVLVSAFVGKLASIALAFSLVSTASIDTLEARESSATISPADWSQLVARKSPQLGVTMALLDVQRWESVVAIILLSTPHCALLLYDLCGSATDEG